MTPPRPRKKKNKFLPPNLYTDKKYYRYKHPVTKVFHSLGKDKAKAIEAANILNARLMPEQSLVNKVLGIQSISIEQVIEAFNNDYAPQRNYSKNSLKEINYRINHIKDWLGDTDIKIIDTMACSSFLDRYSGWAYSLHRSTLIDLFKVAVAKGFIKDNVAQKTLSKTNIKKERQRLTLEQFNTIHSLAEPWLQNAMDLALITAQRRADLVSMKFDDIKDNFLYINQNKGKRHNNESTRLKLTLELPKLKQTVSKCRDTILCPFIIHRKPVRMIRWEGREHHYQVRGETLSKEFSKVRDQSGLFDTLSSSEKPTFHEIRSLAADIYKKMYGKKFSQKLLGHTKEKMTQVYLDGHEELWTEIKVI